MSIPISTYFPGSSYLFHLADFQSLNIGSQVIMQGHVQTIHQQPDGSQVGILEDRTATIPIVVYPLTSDTCTIKPSTIISIAGRVEKDPGHKQTAGREAKRILSVYRGIPASESVFEKRNPVDFIPKRLSTDSEGIQNLGAWIDLIFQPILNKFIRTLLWDPAISHPFVQAAASWKHHHSYPGGLLRHSLEVADMMASMMQSSRIGDPLYELGLVAALLHDLGKIHHMGRPFTRGLLDHQSLTLEKIAPHMHILDEGWPDGATALRHLLIGYESRYRSTMLLLTILKSADKISAASEVEKTLFQRSKANQQFVRAEGPGPSSAFWRPRMLHQNQAITSAGRG